MVSLLNVAMVTKVVTLAVSMIAFMFFLGRAIPIKGKKLNETAVWKKYGVLLLGLLCIGGAFMPTEGSVPLSQWGDIIQQGFTAAMLALIGRAVLPQKLRDRIEGKKKVE